MPSNPDPDRLEHVAMLCEHWADVHFDAAALGGRPGASETSIEVQPVPDSLAAELTLRVHDPERMTFDQAVEATRAEVDSQCPG
ncbi:MAG TPA: hypothetical protein VGF46_05330 [Gaiellales bacterium]